MPIKKSPSARSSTTAAALVLAAGVLAGGLGGCSSSHGSNSGVASGQTHTANSDAPTSLTVVHESDNGSTVRIPSVGGQLILANFSSLWGVPKSSAVTVLSDVPTSQARPACAAKPIGSGCPVPQMVYKAVGKGTATITAHRDMCGEAMRCVAPNAGDFVITVVVDG